MARVGGFTTESTLVGASRISGISKSTAEQDLGYKLEVLISAVNLLSTDVSAIHLALQSAAGSIAGASLFSAFSGGGTATLGAISNFSD